jgi:hypothetical protein
MGKRSFSLHEAEPKRDIHIAWHDDCLVLTVLLASTMSGKEVKKLLEKTGYQELSHEAKPRRLLEALHRVCHHDQKVIGRVAKMLNSRFGNLTAKLKKMDRSQISREAKSRKWLTPYIWACYCHPDEGMRKLGRELAHAAMLKAFGSQAGRDQLEASEAKAAELADQVAGLNRKLAELRKENQSLKIKDARGTATAPAPNPAGAAGQSPGNKELKALRAQLASQKQRLDEQARELATWRSMALNPGDPRVGAPARANKCKYGPDESCPGACERCEDPGMGDAKEEFLQGRRVAIIGGLERLEHRYRELIEGLGGSCLFSAGHTKSGGREFRKIVKKSDLVVCITAINSHGAMKVIKKQCKLCRKPFCPLKGTSVGSLEIMLNQYAKNEDAPMMFGSSN